MHRRAEDFAPRPSGGPPLLPPGPRPRLSTEGRSSASLAIAIAAWSCRGSNSGPCDASSSLSPAASRRAGRDGREARLDGSASMPRHLPLDPWPSRRRSGRRGDHASSHATCPDGRPRPRHERRRRHTPGNRQGPATLRSSSWTPSPASRTSPSPWTTGHRRGAHRVPEGPDAAPGLGFIAFNARALAIAETCRHPRATFASASGGPRPTMVSTAPRPCRSGPCARARRCSSRRAGCGDRRLSAGRRRAAPAPPAGRGGPL